MDVFTHHGAICLVFEYAQTDLGMCSWGAAEQSTLAHPEFVLFNPEAVIKSPDPLSAADTKVH